MQVSYRNRKKIENELKSTKISENKFVGNDHYRVYPSTKNGLTWPQAVKFCEDLGENWSLGILSTANYINHKTGLNY